MIPKTFYTQDIQLVIEKFQLKAIIETYFENTRQMSSLNQF